MLVLPIVHLRSYIATNIIVCHDVTCHAVLIAGSLAQHLATGQTSTRFNLRGQIFKNFLGGHALRLPSKSMLCMLSVRTLSKLGQHSAKPSTSYLSILLLYMVVLTIYERPNLKPKPANPLIYFWISV